MATLETRGYANKVTIKETAKGQMAKFSLGTKQKVFNQETKQKEDQKLYIDCISFDEEHFPAEGEYCGVTGYVTISQASKVDPKTSKPYLNIEVTVKSLERLAQLESKAKPSVSNSSIPEDPFAID